MALILKIAARSAASLFDGFPVVPRASFDALSQSQLVPFPTHRSRQRTSPRSFGRLTTRSISSSRSRPPTATGHFVEPIGPVHSGGTPIVSLCPVARPCNNPYQRVSRARLRFSVKRGSVEVSHFTRSLMIYFPSRE